MRASDTETRGCIQAVDCEWSLAQPHFHGWVVWDQVDWLTARTLPGTNSQAGQPARKHTLALLILLEIIHYSYWLWVQLPVSPS